MRKKINISCSLVILLILCVLPDLFSQGTDVNKSKQTAFYVGLNSGFSQTQIVNSDSKFDSDLKSIPQNTYLVSLEFGYYFSKFIGFSTGIGYSSYHTEYSLSNYQSSYYTFDSEKEFYNRQVTGSDIAEIQKIDYLYFPLSFEFNIPLNPKFSFFLQTGINLSYPINKEYSSSGTFTFKGYYPAYNVLFEDLPQYGFPTNFEYSYEGELVIRPLVTEFTSGAGFHYLANNKYQFGIGANYSFSLSNVSDYPYTLDYQLSRDDNQINSLMEGCSNVSTKAIALKFSFRYYLNR